MRSRARAGPGARAACPCRRGRGTGGPPVRPRKDAREAPPRKPIRARLLSPPAFPGRSIPLTAPARAVLCPARRDAAGTATKSATRCPTPSFRTTCRRRHPFRPPRTAHGGLCPAPPDGAGTRFPSNSPPRPPCARNTCSSTTSFHPPFPRQPPRTPARPARLPSSVSCCSCYHLPPPLPTLPFCTIFLSVRFHLPPGSFSTVSGKVSADLISPRTRNCKNTPHPTYGRIRTSHAANQTTWVTASTTAKTRGRRRNPPASLKHTSNKNHAMYKRVQGLWDGRCPLASSSRSRVTPQQMQGRPYAMAYGHPLGHNQDWRTTTASAHTSRVATRRLTNL